MSKFTFHKDECKNDAKNYFLYFFINLDYFQMHIFMFTLKKCIKTM
jgi:hypothetical protein